MASSALLVCVTVLCVAVTIVSGAGGARGKTPVVPDIASTAFTESEHCSKDHYRIRVRDPNKHISTRLLRYFTFGGILQRIGEETNIPRAELVLGGASQYQDQSSQLGPKYHAAHVIRVGSIDKRLKQKNEDLFKALTNYIGHTQNVISLANVWHGVAGRIDEFQSDNLGELANIIFTGEFEPKNRPKVVTLMDGFRDLIVKYVDSDTRSKTDQSELNAGKIDVWCAGAEMLFNAGKDGYNMVKDGTFKSRYTKA